MLKKIRNCPKQSFQNNYRGSQINTDRCYGVAQRYLANAILLCFKNVRMNAKDTKLFMDINRLKAYMNQKEKLDEPFEIQL